MNLFKNIKVFKFFQLSQFRISNHALNKFKPFLDKKKPHDKIFYGSGLPNTKINPSSKNELIDKFEYVTKYEDLLDILNNFENLFDSDVLSKFIEKFSMYNYF